MLAVLFLCLVPLALSQTATTGELRGTVKDVSGALIPNAAITVTNLVRLTDILPQNGIHASFEILSVRITAPP